MEYGYVAVEGPHDVEFAGRLLKLNGFARVGNLARLDEFWVPLIPRSYPPDDDLLKRVPVPAFFQSSTHSTAIHSATGDTRIGPTIEETLTVLGSRVGELGAIGAILDADSNQAPDQRFLSVRADIAARVSSFSTLPTVAGAVSASSPRGGIYVLPDNVNPGTLEDLLVQCARIYLPATFAAAEAYVQSVRPDVGELQDVDCADFKRPSGRKKATLSCVSNILKPGKAIQVSIQDNEWVSAATVTASLVAGLENFLKRLIGIP